MTTLNFREISYQKLFREIIKKYGWIHKDSGLIVLLLQKNKDLTQLPLTTNI